MHGAHCHVGHLAPDTAEIQADTCRGREAGRPSGIVVCTHLVLQRIPRGLLSHANALQDCAYNFWNFLNARTIPSFQSPARSAVSHKCSSNPHPRPSPATCATGIPLIATSLLFYLQCGRSQGSPLRSSIHLANTRFAPTSSGEHKVRPYGHLSHPGRGKQRPYVKQVRHHSCRGRPCVCPGFSMFSGHPPSTPHRPGFPAT